MIKAEDKKEILDQYSLGYAYSKQQIMRWYGATKKEADQITKQGRAIKVAKFGERIPKLGGGQ